MNSSNSRHLAALFLVMAGVVVGMVLAGGLELTPQATSGPAIPAAASTSPGALLSGGLPDFSNLAAAVDPAVVSIRSAQITSAEERGSRQQQSPFEFFFGPRRPGAPGPREDQPFRQDSGGSGFVVSEDGLIVTNYHVIREADDIKVTLGDREYKATVRGTDPPTDIAVLKIEAPSKLTYLRLGDSEALRVGEWVMAVGSPLDLSHSVTVGVVSAKGRTIGISGDTSFENFIQTDAAINFGNSGGPLLNLAGEVIGINTAINSAAENIGFAVPSNTLKQILPQLAQSGKVRRGYLGLNIRNLDFEAAEAFGLDAPNGALVMSVLPGRPADRAGLRAEDVVLKVDGRTVKTTRDLIDYVSSLGPDATVKLDVLRDGKVREFKVELDERDQADVADEPAEVKEEDAGIEWLKLRYQNLTQSSKASHGLPEDLEGVWVTSVAPDSPLYDRGVRGGDVICVITGVNGQPVATVAEFEKVVKAVASSSRLRLFVRRFQGGQELPPVLAYPQVP